MTKSYFQDDSREESMRQLFKLAKETNEGRSGTDGYLEIKGKLIPFELKTTSDKKGSVTTVRDFGLEHIKKWKDKHWLIGFYSGEKIIYKYGSPAQMSQWVKEKEIYITPDYELANITYERLTLEDLYKVLGKKALYTIQEAQTLHKKQLTVAEYKKLQDKDNFYSPNAMLQILKLRAKYLIERGSTLNNPHIPGGYFDNWEVIDNNHAEKLKELVIQSFAI
jgi:hypothetical protein